MSDLSNIASQTEPENGTSRGPNDPEEQEKRMEEFRKSPHYARYLEDTARTAKRNATTIKHLMIITGCDDDSISHEIDGDTLVFRFAEGVTEANLKRFIQAVKARGFVLADEAARIAGGTEQ
jgi:hypothetical protein